MQLAAFIIVVWKAVLGLWTGEEVAEDEKMTPLLPPTSTSAVVVYSTSTVPSYTMPPLLSFSSLFAIIWMLVLSIVYLSKLPDRLFANACLSYYQGLSERQQERLEVLNVKYWAEKREKEELEDAIANHVRTVQLLNKRNRALLLAERRDHQAEIEKLKNQHSEDLQQFQQVQQQASEQHAAIAAMAAKNHAAEIETLKIEYCGDLEQLQQKQQQANEQQAAIAATAASNHAADIERLEIKSSRDFQNMQRTQEKATKKLVTLAVQASEERNTMEKALRNALDATHDLQTSSDHKIECLEKCLDITRRRQYRAEKELGEQKFIDEDEWDKLRAEKQRAVSEAYGFEKEKDIYHRQLRETRAMYVKQSEEAKAQALTEAIAIQRAEDVQLQLTQRDEELAKSLKRNEVLERLVRKGQNTIDEQEEALSKAETQATTTKLELENLKVTKHKKHSTASARARAEKPMAKYTDEESQLTKSTNDLNKAREELKVLMGKHTDGEARLTKSTNDLNEAMEALRVLNESLTASQLEVMSTSTELNRVKAELGETLSGAVEAQKRLGAARTELAKLKGAEARAFLAKDAADTAKKDLAKAEEDLGIAQADLRNVQADSINTQVALGNTQAALGGTQATLRDTQATLRDTQAASENAYTEHTRLKSQLEETSAELIGLQAGKMSHDLELQKCQQSGRELEFERNNLQQTNSTLNQEINLLRIHLYTAQTKATSSTHNEQNEIDVARGQVDPTNIPATGDSEEPYNSEDDAMGEDEYQLWEDVWPGTSQPEVLKTAGEDQNMEGGDSIAQSSQEEAPPSIAPGVPSGPRELDDIDRELLGEDDDDDEPKKSILPVASKSRTTSQFVFTAPQTIAWPPASGIDSYKAFAPAQPEGHHEQPQPSQEEDTARLIEEELEKDLYGSNEPEATAEGPQFGPQLIYGDYLPAVQPMTREALSSMLYGAKPPVQTPDIPLSTSKIPGLFHEAPAESRPAAAESQEAVEEDASFLYELFAAEDAKASKAPRSTPTGPLFDPRVMSLNEWTLPQHLQDQSSMASYVPEVHVPIPDVRPTPPAAKPPAAKPRKQPLGAFSQAMNQLNNTPGRAP
ncbi:hypothetical protein MMC11_001348 [Xylographa trunciseda]|nr:hypothetical protein [Xylographa trunciseda]